MKSLLLVFASWRMAVVLLTGFSSGIPLALTGTTLQAWMTDLQVDLTVIGVFALVGLPYGLKFLWAPLMDRYVPPFLGRRRGWMIVAQILLVITIASMGFSDPVKSPWLVATLAALVAFFSASQDIVIDAYRTELLKKEEYGVGSGINIMGYRIAMVVSGAVALMLADQLPWRAVYLIMAGTMAIGVVTSLFAPEPQVDAPPPKSLWEAVAHPFLEFFRRKGALEVLAFLVLYKLDVALTLAMMTPFMLEIGFSKTDVGAVTKVFGMVATIAGTITGGAAMLKLGLHRSLWIFGITQGVAGFSFYMLARLGHHYPMMVTAIAAENFFSGMGTAAYMAFMMSLCNKRFTATQFALLTSLMAITRTFAQAPSGWLAKALGWEQYFILCVIIAIPGLLLLTRYKKWTMPSESAA